MRFLGKDLDGVDIRRSYPSELFPRNYTSDYSGPVKLLLPYAGPNTFHSILGITDSNAVIYNTNSFLVDANFYTSHVSALTNYDTHHTIFRRLSLTYTYLKEHRPEIVVDKEMFLLVNPFSASNIGHDLSILFDRIHIYKSRGYTMPVVVGDVMNSIPRSFEVCKTLLPDTEFYFLPSDKIVQFTNLHVSKNVIFDILRHRGSIVRDLINASIESIPAEELENYKGKKIILMKTNLNKQIVTSITCFTCSSAIDQLVHTHGFIYINPETMPMRDIIVYLYHARQIVTSFGAISYAHGIFFNPAITYQFIKTNYDPYYDREKYRVIRMPLNIDADIPGFIRAITV
jgi:hypothetical protein